MTRAHETFFVEEMKVFSGLSPSELVGRHLHKLVQVMHLCKFISFPYLFIYLFIFKVMGESLYLTSEYLTQEAKVESAVSRVAALEAENLKLKKDLRATMDEANTAKEKVKTLSDDFRAKR